VGDADCYRRLADAIGDLHTLINIIALLPYAVTIQQAVPMRLADRIPPQRRPQDGVPWSTVWAGGEAKPVFIPQQRAVPLGVPARPRIQPRRIR
jgi:hypothetical protein